MIVDTGVFVAAANADEPYHDSCAALLQSTSGRLIVPALIIAEATYLIEQANGSPAEATFLRSLRSHRYQVEAPTEGDLLRVAELVDQYSDLPLGGTDASIVALAERLQEVEIGTLDRRHSPWFGQTTSNTSSCSPIPYSHYRPMSRIGPSSAGAGRSTPGFVGKIVSRASSMAQPTRRHSCCPKMSREGGSGPRVVRRSVMLWSWRYFSTSITAFTQARSGSPPAGRGPRVLVM